MKPGDFVVLVESFDGIDARSVGQVKHVNGDMDIYFIGDAQRKFVPPHMVRELDVSKTGKPKTGQIYPHKICNICFKLKDHETEFARNQTDGKGRPTYRPSCLDCRVAITGKTITPAEKQRMNRFKPKLHSVYTCPICQKVMIVGVTAKVVAEHNNSTGKGRDWICDSCNTGLGRFKDDPAFLEAAIDYFKRHG